MVNTAAHLCYRASSHPGNFGVKPGFSVREWITFPQAWSRLEIGMCEIIDRPTDRPSLQKNKATIPRRSIDVCASIAGGWERFLFPKWASVKIQIVWGNWKQFVCSINSFLHLILVARRLHLYLLFAYSQTIKLYQGSSIRIKSKTIWTSI